MPQCYLLLIAAGSSLDQQSNNVTLFNLVEQINVPPGNPPRPGSRIPLELHAYLSLHPHEVGQDFEMRFCLVHPLTGLETFSEPATHRSATPRIRTRSLGLPVPPVLGHYDLRVDFKAPNSQDWQRDPASWPISIVEAERRSSVTN